MNLYAAMKVQGQSLFRWRGYVPVLALITVLIGLDHYRYLAGSKFFDDLWQLGCVLLACLGLSVRALVVGHTPKDTSGRNAREQRAEVLNTTGMYSIVRHPLYVGNFLVFLGVVSFLHQPWPMAVCVLGFALYHERIMLAEEAFLEQRFGDEFREWAARTPAVIPDPRAWLYSNLPFSLRNVLRREYNNAFGVVLAMFLLDAASDSAAQHRLTTGYWWERLMFVGFVLWLILRTLKRRTEVLRVAGR
jgi:protein-S-isoprenylcysteine O-methyltransferase Ste14